MDKLCSKCGKKLNEDEKYCVNCGTSVEEFSIKLESKSLEDNTNNKEEVNRNSESVTVNKNGKVKTSSIEKVFTVVNNKLYASPIAGETTIGGFSPFSSINNIQNPFKIIIDGVKSIITNFKNVFKNKKNLIIAIVLAVVWIILSLLSILGLNTLPVKMASWLTFAQGGLKGGILGLLGGIIGKGMFATLIFSILSGGIKSVKAGFKKPFTCFNNKSINTMLIGIGVALIMFNLMAGISSPIQSMVGISGCLLSLQALGSKKGFIHKIIVSLTATKDGKSLVENTNKCETFISGLSLGFAAGTLISFIPWGYVPYCVGLVSVITGIILGIILKNKDEVSE